MIEVPPVVPQLNLQPGELRIVRSPAVLRTILGSCVSVTFWNQRLGIGAMSHGVLPRCPILWPPGSSLSDGYRFVDFSIRYLAQEFDSLGSRRSDLQVKVFGGADVLPVAENRTKLTVGALNCQAAIEVLAEQGLTVLASDLGGIRGRHIHLYTETGDVMVHRLAEWSDSLMVDKVPRPTRIMQ